MDDLKIEKRNSEEKQTTPKAKQPKKTRKEKRIYVGPNLIQLTRYTVFADGVPKHIESLIQKCPAVEKLIVPLSRFAESERRINQKGTLEYRHFQAVLSFLSEQRKGDQ